MSNHLNWKSFLVTEPEFRVQFYDATGEERSLSIEDFNTSELQIISDFVSWQVYNELTLIDFDNNSFMVWLCNNETYPASSLIYNFEELSQSDKDIVNNLYNMLMTK